MYMWTFKGNPSAQWQMSVGEPSRLLHDKETIQLHRVLMVSEFLLVSMGFVSQALMISVNRRANSLDLSSGIAGWRRRPASRSLS